MVHTYIEIEQNETHDCPVCGRAPLLVEGQVEGGQLYENKVTCTNCGKVLWSDFSWGAVGAFAALIGFGFMIAHWLH